MEQEIRFSHGSWVFTQTGVQFEFLKSTNVNFHNMDPINIQIPVIFGYKHCHWKKGNRVQYK